MAKTFLPASLAPAGRRCAQPGWWQLSSLYLVLPCELGSLALLRSPWRAVCDALCEDMAGRSPFHTGSCALLEQQGFLQEHQPWRQLVQSIPSLCIPDNIPAVSKGYGESGRDHSARETPRDRLDMLKCVLSEMPSTVLTLTELSPASPRARLNSGFRILGIPCCPGRRPHTRMCIHATFPSSPVAVGAHWPKQGAPNGLGSLVPAAGCPYQACYRGVPLAPTILCCVCYLLLDMLAHSPEGESSGWSKTTANTGVGTPGSSAWGHAPGSPMLCHLGVMGDHPGSLQTKVPGHWV